MRKRPVMWIATRANITRMGIRSKKRRKEAVVEVKLPLLSIPKGIKSQKALILLPFGERIGQKLMKGFQLTKLRPERPKQIPNTALCVVNHRAIQQDTTGKPVIARS